jgi:hypothetical protein
MAARFTHLTTRQDTGWLASRPGRPVRPPCCAGSTSW